jgi:hypothetical protein
MNARAPAANARHSHLLDARSTRAVSRAAVPAGYSVESSLYLPDPYQPFKRP